MLRVLTVSVLTCFAIGCATATTTEAPTHRWASTGAADKVKYHNDHARCQAQADVNGDAFDATSDAFNAYKQCMTNSGYVLTAYSK